MILSLALRGLGAESGRSAAKRGFLIGVGCFTPMLFWAWVAAGPGYPFLILYVSLWWAATFFAIRRVALSARPPWFAPFLAGSVWTAAEYVKGLWPYGGFTWGDPGYALIDLGPARNLASWGGIHGVTFMLVATATAVALLLERRRAPAPAEGTERRSGLVLAAPLVGLAIVWGVAGVVDTDGTYSVADLNVALVQGNDFDRDLTGSEQSQLLPARHLELATRFAPSDRLDLLVFPESSFGSRDPRNDAELTPRVENLARYLDSYVMTNSTLTPGPDALRQNTNILFNRQGVAVDLYTKQHLVPFGEYIPFRSVLEKVVPQVSQVPVDFEPGPGDGLFMIEQTPVGNLICFESAFGRDTRALARQGAQLLVVSTNNRSFGDTSNASQHLAMSRMRAAETGRYVVHSAISGISAVVDSRGVVLEQTPLLSAATVSATVETRGGETPYVRFGPFMVAFSVLLICAALVIQKVRPRVGPAEAVQP